VARLLGRKRNPYQYKPPAYAQALIGYTTKRDAINGSRPYGSRPHNGVKTVAAYGPGATTP
jgi:hypothetical protein